MSSRSERLEWRAKFEQFTITIETEDAEFVRRLLDCCFRPEPKPMRGWQTLDCVRFVLNHTMTMTIGEGDQKLPVEKFALPLRTRLYRDGDIVRFAVFNGAEEFTTDILASNQDLLERIDRRNAQVDEALLSINLDDGLNAEVTRSPIEIEAAELTTAPSGLTAALTGFVPSKVKPEHWAARREVNLETKQERQAGRLVTKRWVRVTLDNATRSRSQGRKPNDPTMLLPFEATTGPIEHINEMMWATLAGLDTDCLLTAHAIVQECLETDNKATENVSSIARRRGWSEKGLDKRGNSDRTKRQRVRDHLELLFRAEFHITDTRARNGEPMVLTLLVPHGTIPCKGNRRGRKARLFGLNPYMWDAWMKKGREMCFHPSLLHADPVRDDWAVRIALYLSGRWAQGWAGDGYYASGGEQRVKVGSVVVSAGLHVSKIREDGRPAEPQPPIVTGTATKLSKIRADGRPAEPSAFRAKFRAALERLQAWPGSPGHIGAFEIVENSDPREDLLIVSPPAAVAHRLTTSNSKRIASVERKRALPPATGAALTEQQAAR